MLSRGALGAQSVKRPTLHFGSGQDLTVCDMKAHVRLYASAEPAWDSLSTPLSCPFPACAHMRMWSLSE